MSRLEFGLALAESAPAFEQLDAHAHARQRRAQFVRGVGEQHLVRGDQFLDARGGAVEAFGELARLRPCPRPCTRADRSPAPSVSTPAAAVRGGASGRARRGRRRARRAARWRRGTAQRDTVAWLGPRRPAHDEPAPVGQSERPGRAARGRNQRRVLAVRPAAAGGTVRARRCGRRSAVEQAMSVFSRAAKPVDRLLLLRAAGRTRGERRRRQLARHFERLPRRPPFPARAARTAPRRPPPPEATATIVR